MSIIQIDVTNACPQRCSNCTRFCGHHTSPYYMDHDFFRKAVDSMDGFRGVVGMMGGEPTLHPDFEKMVLYLCGKRNPGKYSHSLRPIKDMNHHMKEHLIAKKGELIKKGRAGLWSALNKHYLKHFEVINDSFDYQILNDHDNTCMHQALLVSRKELGIPDEEWEKKRDACWIQNTWSASITPKGAFFCEIAAMLDILFDGPGGWKVEPGWWQRDISDYKDQLHWCELCGGCLNVPKRLSYDGRDDITPKIIEKLKNLGSPKVRQGKYVVLDPQTYDPAVLNPFVGPDDYMSETESERIGGGKTGLYEKKFSIYVPDALSEYLQDSKKDWAILTLDQNVGNWLAEEMQNWILNPGCLFWYEDTAIFNKIALSVRDRIKEEAKMDINMFAALYPEQKIIDIKSVL